MVLFHVPAIESLLLHSTINMYHCLLLLLLLFFHFKHLLFVQNHLLVHAAHWQCGSCVCWCYTDSVAHHAVYVVRKLQLE